MQPRYLTLSSSGSSPWQMPDWHINPQDISFAVISTGGSSWSIDVCYEDPTGTFPSPISTSPTPFSLATGSSNQVVALPSSLTPIAGFRFNLNSQSSAGARVTLVSMQGGIAG